MGAAAYFSGGGGWGWSRVEAGRFGGGAIALFGAVVTASAGAVAHSNSAAVPECVCSAIHTYQFSVFCHMY